VIAPSISAFTRELEGEKGYIRYTLIYFQCQIEDRYSLDGTWGVFGCRKKEEEGEMPRGSLEVAVCPPNFCFWTAVAMIFCGRS